MAVTQDGMGALTAPVAVRVLDLDAPLGDLDLSYEQLRGDYRSLLAVVRLAEHPIGVATFPVEPGGFVRRDQLAGGLRRQLGAVLSEAYAKRNGELRPGASVNRLEGPGDPVVDPSPSVSVVVPTCSNPRSLERCLRSILRCDYDDFEVIVVENRPGSSDTARMLVERFPGERRIRYVEEPRPSASLARNAGLARAEGEIVAFTDDDIVVDPLWIRASVQAMLSASGIACVTGLILPLELESKTQLLLEQFAGFGKGFERKTYRLPESRQENPLLPYAAGALGSGASIVIRTDVARELGGFDPALGPPTPAAGGEDLDLLVRVLRSGHGLSYEPRAIVWHEHPAGEARLRRQVYNYGIGLGAMLGKQLIAGPDRRDFLRAIPAGLRYLRDPGSRKNEGKPASYPRHLTWLERLGMLIGPIAYIVSAVTTRLRALRTAPPLRPQPTRIVRRMLVDGESINVVWFKEAEEPSVRFAWRRTAERRTAVRQIAGPPGGLVVGAALTCVAAPLLTLLGAPSAVRTPFALALLGLVPGIAWLTAVRARAETGLLIGISLGVSALGAQSMLWLGSWRPGPFLCVLAAPCLAALAPRLISIAGGARADAAASLRRLGARLGRAASSRRTALHGALIAGAAAAWGMSLAGADLGRIDGVGLLGAMPVTFFLAFALLLAGFAAAARDQGAPARLLGAYVLGLIVLIDATTAILYAEPRYAWTYPHVGVINLLAATGRADRQVDIYNNWPSFFALSAWFDKASGLAALKYAGWAQLWFNLCNVFALRFALRGLTRDERVLWTATLFFVLGNWVGQDYLAPQAFAFVLSLVVIGLCLRCGREVAAAPYRGTRWLAARLSRLDRALLPRRTEDDEPAPRPISRRSALLLGGICYLAIVTSHQLSPVMVTVSVLFLALVTRKVPLWVPVAMALIELWWVLMAWSFLTAHFHLIDPGGAGAAAPGRDLSVALPGAALSFYAPAAVMMLIAVLALTGLVRRVAAGKRDLVAACLITAPLAVVAVQSYGGEGPYRGYLFALPWFAFLAAFACIRRGASAAGTARISLPRLLLGASAVGACLLFAFFGQEAANHVSTNDVRAAVWYERNAPAGAMRVDLASNAPNRITPRYGLVDLSDPVPLVGQLGFTGHRLGPSDVPRLIRLIEAQKARPAYVVLSDLQQQYARLNGLLPEGSLAGLVGALGQSPSFRLVYHLPTVWIFEYTPATTSQPYVPPSPQTP